MVACRLQVDAFEFEDVPIGALTKLRLTLSGHNSTNQGPAWYCESVVVTTLVEGDSGGWVQEAVAYFWGDRWVRPGRGHADEVQTAPCTRQP